MIFSFGETDPELANVKDRADGAKEAISDDDRHARRTLLDLQYALTTAQHEHFFREDGKLLAANAKVDHLCIFSNRAGAHPEKTISGASPICCRQEQTDEDHN
eukprot:CAMPEP_0206422154 /NCGR_PEP_ID=MMETSP0324_2-20121206/1907_1 /ASSEMBLY_ACC=CAM_ASM_000836 /TAXON_ID=2866 /ORGANISM="Crypthecodinium cohnii, Strain Seligo" /LENGTH=102 /DNA_ID=CAMNT_0053886451 /DNA_START=252 /DNA_END=560 /DNA_ORIENTATION=+